MWKFFKYCLLILLIWDYSCDAQIILNIAGGGTGGDGGPATDASIYDPNGIAIDKLGNIYFATNLGNQVKKISSLGVLSTVAGTGVAGFAGDGGPASAALLNQPVDVAFDAADNIYVAEAGSNRIRKISAGTGLISTVAGNGSSGYSGDLVAASATSLKVPTCVYFDNAGNMYIADGGNYRIRKVNPSGIIYTVAGNGLSGCTGDGGAATAAKCVPEYLRVDVYGNIWVAEWGNYRVRKINTFGIITTIAGDSSSYVYNGDGIPATVAHISPIFITLNHEGHLFISDFNNNRIRKIQSDGTISTVAGSGLPGDTGDGGLATLAKIDHPSGLAFDTCDNLIFGQVNTPRIRKVTFNPDPCPHLGVKQEQEPNVRIYPNPITDELHIDGLTSNTNYTLLNITGIIEQRGTIKEAHDVITVSHLPPGIYLLELTDAEGNRTIRKIIKQ